MIFTCIHSLLSLRLLGARQQTCYLGLLARDACHDGANERFVRASGLRAACARCAIFDFLKRKLLIESLPVSENLPILVRALLF